MSEASAPTGCWLRRALGHWLELTGRDYMRIMGLPLDGSQAPDPIDAYVADGIDQIERFLARPRRRSLWHRKRGSDPAPRRSSA